MSGLIVVLVNCHNKHFVTISDCHNIRLSLYFIHSFFAGIPAELMERQSATTSITVMWYYTKEFEAITSDPALYMAGLVNHANTAYQNSNLNLKLTTMCMERLPDSFVEADDVGALFTNFVNAKGKTKRLFDNFPMYDFYF